MADEVCIRLARAQDAQAIAQVHAGAWQQAYAGLIPAPLLATVTPETRLPGRVAVLADPAVTSLVACLPEQGGRVVGFADCGAARDSGTPDAGELYAVYLLEAWQGRKVGLSLMTTSAAQLRRRGHREMVLWVLQGNCRARQFYDTAGGRACSSRQSMRAGYTIDEVAYRWDGAAMEKLAALAPALDRMV
ncbi:N-acetyltransferase family protein [Paracidovorax citrulli]